MLLLVSVALTAGVLLATQRYGVRALLPLTGLLCLAATVLFDSSAGLAPLVGLVVGFQIERRQSYGLVVAAGAIPGAILSLWLLITQQARLREELAKELTRQLEAMGMQLVEEGYSLREMIAAVLRVQPAIEFVTLLLAVVLAYRVGVWGGGRLHIVLPGALPFRLWRPWDELIWVLIAGLLLGLVGWGLLEELAFNLLVVMAVLYAVHGLALIRFFVWRLGLSRLLELVFYAALFFSSGLGLILLAGLGLLDTWFDWRGLRSGEGEE